MSNTSKTSKSLVLTAALLALLSSPSPGMAAGPAPVDLGTAGNFVILAETGISTTAGTAIVGDIGVSPYATTAITGFGLILDPSLQFSTSALVVGNVYAADNADPTPATLTTAVSDMQTAYTDAAGRTSTDIVTELGAGNISGLTLAPGLYKWGGVVTINNGASVTLSGKATDVWIFQIGTGLTVGNSAQVILKGGAQAKNIFWQVGTQTTLGTTANFKGIILSGTAIVLNTGAALSGRALAQSAVTLDANAVTAPEFTKTQCQGVLKAEKTVFDDKQKADKQAWQIANPHPTSADKKAFDDVQKADKQAFAAQQKIDKAQCNTLP